ncbi:hypothetical protein [Massilia arenae]|uniref:Uncharacterized protein n=1 Tax=Massilia arenae TaxID=2603288 RepID=A0A5C7FV60_9BURK|nr:hypothetical protein [Massilia arenae]TXF99225.1 hypothetical protein FVD38_13640 [Massilia arenae]
MNTSAVVSFSFPDKTGLLKDLPEDVKTAFDVDAQGVGSFTGLSYTVPAHTRGTLTAKIQTLAMTSNDVATLNELVMSMLSATQRNEVKEHEETNVSANISVWSIFGGGASASYSKTKDTMHSMGLTDEQITIIVNKMMDIAINMSTVELNFEIDNTDNDYSVSGDLQLYTISGTIKTDKGTAEYRMLADRGTAGSDSSAKANGNIISLK